MTQRLASGGLAALWMVPPESRSVEVSRKVLYAEKPVKVLARMMRAGAHAQVLCRLGCRGWMSVSWAQPDRTGQGWQAKYAEVEEGNAVTG